MKNLKKTLKRGFAMFLSLIMVLGIMQTSALAASDQRALVLTVSSYGAPFVSGSTGAHTVRTVTETKYIPNSSVGSTNPRNNYAEVWFEGSNSAGWDLYVKIVVGNYTITIPKFGNARVTNKDMSNATGRITFGWSTNYETPVKTSLSISGATDIPPETQDVTLTYKANGGTGSDVIDTQTVNAGLSASFTLKPGTIFTAPAGKEFDYWSTTANGTGRVSSPYVISRSAVLYAIWKDTAPVKEAEKSGTAQLQILKTFEGADKPSSFYMTYSITNTAVGGNQGRGTLLFTELVPGLYSANVNYPTWTFTGNWTVAEKAGYDSVITLTERGADISGKDLTITADGATVSGNTITYKVGAQATGGDMLEITNSYTGTVQPAPETPVTHKSIQVENSTGGWDDVHVDEETGMTDPIAAGSHVKYTITVTNPGSVDYQELSIVDMMDSELTLTPNSTQTWLVVNGVETPIVGPDITTTGGTMQTWSVTDTVPAGAHVKITYEADVGPYQISSMDNSLTATVILPQPINSAAYGYSAQSESAPNAYSSTAVVRLVTKAPANDGNKDVSPTSDAESADEISGLAR